MEYPASCVEAGLSCETCTESSARELARACPGLPQRVVVQLFVQIHTHAACARMHAHFSRAYAESRTMAAAVAAA